MISETKSKLPKISGIVLALTIVAGTLGFSATGANAEDNRTFPETGKTVSGRFLEYWDSHGGLAQQGFPVSDEMAETSDIDGKVYLMQYFERAVFEYHPENPPPHDVLLSLLGVRFYSEKYDGNAPDQAASADNPHYFPETGKTIGGVFREYWEQRGGLAQQGYPVSDEFQEVSIIDGNTYTVQYFERAVFEYHPEFAGTENEVQLSLLGAMTLNSKYPDGPPPQTLVPVVQPTITAAPPAPPSGTALFAKPGWTHIVPTTNNIVIFASQVTRDIATARIGADGTLTPLQVYPNPQKGFEKFPVEFTHVIAGPNNLVYFYEQITGVVVYTTVYDDGTLAPITIGSRARWSPDWTHIVFDTEGMMAVFYDAVRSRLLTARINDDGSGTDLYDNADPNQQTWDQIVPLGNGIWFAYIASGDSGAGLTLRLNADGMFTFLNPYYDLSPDWTHIVSDNSHLLFYSKHMGTALTSSIGADGVLTELMSFEGWQQIWDPVVATKNDAVIFYDASSGWIFTDRLNDDGSYTDLQEYRP